MVKYQFGKNWSWCNEVKSASLINDKNIDIVYRLDAAPCSLGACKTNCVGNPYCLNGLGEKKLMNLMNKEPSQPLNRDDYLRSLADYAGLVNLGATCYINTYLQVWYNNIIFREHMLRVKFEQIKVKNESSQQANDSACGGGGESEAMPSLKFESSECLGANLQMMFSLMKESVRKSIDPNFFIRAIGLDENMQQDAQEFSQLFLTKIQSSLSSFDMSAGKNDIIQELFEGEYSYITECSECKRQSIRHSNFVELSLNIQNCSTIKECLDDLLKEEIMDGENQYYCSRCDHKRNAKRMTKLARLPPVLNLQLLRFVYDRNSGYKKKLSTRIKFSEILDLNPYAEKSNGAGNGSKSSPRAQEQPVYQLGAILMHVGKTAYSGHYMAQIKNFKSNEWYNFNDEVITKIKRKQQLGCTEEEIDSANSKQANGGEKGGTSSSGAGVDETTTKEGKEGSGTESATPSSKGTNKVFSTANAYLLVYYRTDLMNKMSTYDDKTGESNQHKVVAEDNQRLENWFDVLRTNKINQNDYKNTERAVVHSIFESLWCNKSSEGKSRDTETSTKQASSVDRSPPSGSNGSAAGDTTSSASKRLTRNASSSRDLSKSSSNGSSALSKAGQRSPTSEPTVELDKKNLFFVTTDFLKKMISQQSNIYPSDAASINSIQKYMCPHKRLNPLAISRFKVVSKQGIDQIMDCYNLRPADIGALEVYNEETTLCRQCVVNCFEYLRCKEQLKQDGKTLRQLLKFDAPSDDNLKMLPESMDAESELSNQPNSKPASETQELSEQENEVILIDTDENSTSNPGNHQHHHDGELNGHDKEPVSPSRTLFSNINGIEKSGKHGISENSLSCESINGNGLSQGRKNSTSNENKENSNGSLLNGSGSNTRYYIGKESLKCWQNLVLKRLEAQLPSFKFVEPIDGLPSSQNGKPGADVVEEVADQAEIQEIMCSEDSTSTKEAEKKSTQSQPGNVSQQSAASSVVPASISVFNEDITCPHNCLSPTQNKRLITSALWHKIFASYFYSDDLSKLKASPVFTDEAKECKLCLKTNEEISNKKIEVKFQKEVLTDLYFNKQRPTFQTMEPYTSYFLIMSEFVKEWRAMIKQFKFKDIKILNQVLLCQHLCLPFDKDSFDESMIMLLTENEWSYLSQNYEFDMDITVMKVPKEVEPTGSQIKDESSDGTQGVVEAQGETSAHLANVQYDYIFKPASCQVCLQQNELTKMQFENKKIFIRQIDEDNLTTTPVPSSVVKAAIEYKDDDMESTQVVSKKARLSENVEKETGSSTLPKTASSSKIIPNASQGSAASQASSSSSNIRRSKRTRKCKGDIELLASSSSTIKSIKIQIAAKVSRMLSEQHIFFNNAELDNEKTLADYGVLAGDILYLKIDQITNDEIDSSPYEFAHLPEIGFKGTNLLK